MRKFIASVFGILILFSCSNEEIMNASFSNPADDIKLEVNLNENGELIYRVSYKDKGVLEESKLGLFRKDSDFSKNLKIIIKV